VSTAAGPRAHKAAVGVQCVSAAVFCCREKFHSFLYLAPSQKNASCVYKWIYIFKTPISLLGKRLEEITAFPVNGARTSHQVICVFLFPGDVSSDRNICFDSLTKIVILVQHFFFHGRR